MRPIVPGFAVLLAALGACTEEAVHPFPEPPRTGNDAGEPGFTGGKSGSGGSAGGAAPAPSDPGGAPASSTGGTPSATGGKSTGGAGAEASGGRAQLPTGGASGRANTGGAGAAATGGRGSDVGGAGGSAEPAGQAGAGPGPGTQDHFRLAVIGSSTSAGEGASSSAKGWVGLLTSALEDAVATDFTCNNLSVGGYSSASLLPDGSSGNIDDAIERDPDLIIVALAGSNDLSAGTSKETFFSRLSELRARGEEAGIPVFFLTTAPKDLSDDEQEALQDWANTIAEDLGVCWVPAEDEHAPCVIDVFEPLANGSLGVRSEFSAGDGIHLNDTGHAEIFRVVEAVIRPYVCSVTTCR